MDNTWSCFEVAFERVVERFVYEARQRPLMKMQVPRWDYVGGGSFQYVSTPVFWTDQSLGMLMPYWEEYLNLEICARQSQLAKYLGSLVGGSGIRLAFHLISFTLGTIGDALRTTSSTVHCDASVVGTRLSQLRSAIDNELVETEILILLGGLELEDDIELGGSISVRRANVDTMIKFIQIGLLPVSFDPQKIPTLQLPENQWVVLRKAYREPKVVGNEFVAGPPRGSGSDIAAREFENFADVLGVMSGRRPRLMGWMERVANDALGHSWSSGSSPTISHDAVALASSDADRVASIWRGVDATSKIPKAKAVALAVRRMGFASTRERWEDRLLDAMIALEALLLSDNGKDRGELRFRMSFRAAQALPNGVSSFTSGEIFFVMKHAYDVRSALAHGSDVNVGNMFNIRERRISHGMLLEVVMQIGRLLTESAIEAVSLEKRYFIDWDEKLARYLDSMSSRI